MKLMNKLLLLTVCCYSVGAMAGATFRDGTGNNSLFVEVVEDDIVHLEWADTRHSTTVGMVQSPMIAMRGTEHKLRGMSGNVIETKTLRLKINTNTLCVEATDIRNKEPYLLSRLCPDSLREDSLKLTFSRLDYFNVFGLGEQHSEPGQINGDWSGKRRTPGNEYGNEMVAQGGGAVGNLQIPIAYLLGQGKQNYALFIDSAKAQRWDFTADPYSAQLKGNAIRTYLIGGRDLPELRRNYLKLTGNPAIPPKQLFGLWLSEYSFDSWSEVEAKVGSVRSAKIPVDGVFLDVEWFGGVMEDSDATKVGSMRWDKGNFPNPERKIAEFKNNWGLGIIPIEQPYIGKRLPEYLTMATKGYLVRQCPYPCDPVYLNQKYWWGRGAMIDFTHQEGGDFWHNWRRQPLIDAGVMGHWTSLGEPEHFDMHGWYYGVSNGQEKSHSHGDVHNLYNLLWVESINEGYKRHKVKQRPFVLSRSGTAGIQRYGTAIWSGDIGANLANLASHINTQMHMSLSGIDYYGSDLGGFHRQALRGGDRDELYTQWLAVSAAIDIPMRPHAENLCNCNPTTPDQMGDVKSNVANIQQRYALTPYYYSLAHEAYRTGEAVIPPMVYHFQDDPGVRTLANQKMIGKDMLVATVAEAGAKEVMVYLPAGEWIDYHDDSRYESQGEWVGPFPLRRDGIYRLPVFVRAGAIIPHYWLKDGLTNSLGLKNRNDYSATLLVTAYLGSGKSKFVLYEDDNTTTEYQSGRVGSTDLVLKHRAKSAELTVAEGQGRYEGVPPGRTVNALFITRGERIKRVTYRDEVLPKIASEAEFDKADRGWFQQGTRVWVKVGMIKREFVNHVEIHW